MLILKSGKNGQSRCICVCSSTFLVKIDQVLPHNLLPIPLNHTESNHSQNQWINIAYPEIPLLTCPAIPSGLHQMRRIWQEKYWPIFWREGILHFVYLLLLRMQVKKAPIGWISIAGYSHDLEITSIIINDHNNRQCCALTFQYEKQPPRRGHTSNHQKWSYTGTGHRGTEAG